MRSYENRLFLQVLAKFAKMESFKIIPPSPILAPYVKHYWILRIDEVMQTCERVIPTGYVQLVFHKGDRMISSEQSGLQPRSFVGGQSMGFSDLISSGRTHMIVVAFHPAGARPFFNLPLDKFFGLNISVGEIEDRTYKELEDKLMNIDDDYSCIQLIENHLMSRLHLLNGYNYARIGAAVGLAYRESEIDAISFAAESCLSAKQFGRIFSEYVGISPKKFLRIVRFHRALHTWQNNRDMELAQLACECGFYDQPHMIHEFKTFSGYSPTEYLAVCAPHSDLFSAS